MRAASSEFKDAGITPVVIVQARADQLEESTGDLEGVIVVPDPSHITHRAMALGHMSIMQLLRSKAVRAAGKRAKLAGHGQNWSRTFGKGSDTLLNPGAALVNCAGKVLWIHRGQDVGDLPSPVELLKIAKGL